MVRVFRGQEMGESQKDLLRACAREEIDVHMPFEELPKADQDFVINGEKRASEYTDDDYENDRWYGVRGFFQMAREQDLQNARARLAQPLSRLHDMSELQRRTFPAGGAELQNCSAVCNRRNQTNGAHSAPQQLALPEFAALSDFCRARSSCGHRSRAG